MNIQGFQKMTLLDYPEHIACTVFTGGCNFRCPFCHNAGLVLSPSDNQNMISEVIHYLQKRKGLLDGVCITGGEPLLQADIFDFIQDVKSLGYKVKLDTNGAFPDKLEKILSLGIVDYVAMDIKSSIKNYHIASGVNISTDDVMKSIQLIRNSGIDYEFRTTTVKGIHTEEDFELIGSELLKEQDKYFIQRFVDSGNTIKQGFCGFEAEELHKFLGIIQKYAPLAKFRGI